MRKITRTALVSALVAPLLFASVPAANAGEIPGKNGACSSFNKNTVVNVFEVRDARTALINTTSTLRSPRFTVTSTAYTASGQKLWTVDKDNVGAGTRVLRLDNPVRKGWYVSTTVSAGGIGGRLSTCVVKDKF